MSFSDFLEDELLDHVFGAAAYSAPATLYIGLSSADPLDDGSGLNEPSGGSYARVAVTNNATNFPAASGGAKANGTAVTFPTATATWVGGADLTHFGVFDADAAGNLLGSAELSLAKPVLDGDTAEFAIGDLAITLV